MAPKKKPKDEIKKPKKSKFQNQVLLFQYFPNLNHNKTKAYEKILSKPNAVFKQEKKLNKQILTEQNQIIKQINNLFRQVFQQANHEQINMFAQLFPPVESILRQRLEEKIPALEERKMSESNFSLSNTFMSPQKKSIINQNGQDISSQHTRTVTARKSETMDLTDFEFHESKYKEKQVYKIRAQWKYSETVFSPEETITMIRQVKPLTKSQSIPQGQASIDWKVFEFNPSMNKTNKSSRKSQENLGNSIGQDLNITPNQQPLVEETITLQLKQSATKSLSFDQQESLKDEQKPQFNQVQVSNEWKELEKKQETIIYQQPKQDSKTLIKIQQVEEDESSLRFSLLNINCQSAMKEPQVQKNQLMGKRLKEGINKIISLIQKQHKAKEQEINFRKYVQQIKQKNRKSNPLNAQEDVQVNKQFTTEFVKDEEKLCSVKILQDHILNPDTQFDVLNCILHREPNPRFVCYFESHQDYNDSPKQLNYQIKENFMEICFQTENEYQESTKQQSEASDDYTVSSSRFIRFVDSLQSSFDVPEHYLAGYERQVFNPNFFRKIHQIEMLKARYEAQILNQII